MIDPPKRWASVLRHSIDSTPKGVEGSKRALAIANQGATLAPRDCYMLDALAAADAGMGNFDEAVAHAKQAITAAPPELATAIRQRLALYQQGKSFFNQPSREVRAASHEEPIWRPRDERPVK